MPNLPLARIPEAVQVTDLVGDVRLRGDPIQPVKRQSRMNRELIE
jgi:hypothetical protein